MTDVIPRSTTETVAATAMARLEDLFGSMCDEERAVISDMVHAALIHAVTAGTDLPVFAKGLTGRTAPTLVASVSVPGSVEAYSHVNCGEFTVRGTAQRSPR